LVDEGRPSEFGGERPGWPAEELKLPVKFNPPTERFFLVGRRRAEAGDRGLVPLPASATVTYRSGHRSTDRSAKKWPPSISYAAVSSSHGRRPRDFRGIYCHRLAEWRDDVVARYPHFAADASIGIMFIV
jgi:hypothetical protein